MGSSGSCFTNVAQGTPTHPYAYTSPSGGYTPDLETGGHGVYVRVSCELQPALWNNGTNLHPHDRPGSHSHVSPSLGCWRSDLAVPRSAHPLVALRIQVNPTGRHSAVTKPRRPDPHSASVSCDPGLPSFSVPWRHLEVLEPAASRSGSPLLWSARAGAPPGASSKGRETPGGRGG